MTSPERTVSLWRPALLRWFARHRRPMPWRDAPTPYRVWISEMMLQQTQVATVGPYFERFMARFPDVTRLARARAETVLKVWEGLGYYRRARHLHAAARQIVHERRGVFPESAAAWRALPGLGPYAAAAVASISQGAAVPAIDGNVRRVMARMLGLRGDPRRREARARIEAALAAAISRRAPGRFNEALMELGALVCRPRRPACGRCPLNRACKAFAEGRTDHIPFRPPRRPVPHRDVVACVLTRRDRVLIARRPADAMLGGLWEFPGGKQEPGETLETAVVREIREELGCIVRPTSHLGTVRHAFSHFRMSLHAFRCELRSGTPRAIGVDAIAWVRPANLDRYPMPVADRRIAAML